MDDDVDARFKALVENLELSPPESGFDDEVAEAPEAFSLEREIESADPDPEPVPRMPRLSARGVVIVSTAVFALVVVIAAIAGAQIPIWLGVAAVVAALGSITLGLASLPRRHGERPDDGAEV